MEKINHTVMPKQRIGIALSGGGIKGLCHAGALKALEEYGIKPDIISGVSAGAIVGALYADGHSPDEIGDFFRNVTFRQMTKIEMHGGFFKINEFENFLDERLRAKNFEDLQIELKIVATDLDKGKSVTFSQGTLLQKIIASCTVPVLFAPTAIDGINYVDGGVLKNFPVSTIREDCDVLIGINASPMVAAEYKLGIMSVAMRSYHFMMKANTLHDKEICDILIEPTDMGNYDTFDVGKGNEIFEVGYTSTKKIIEESNFLSKIK
ncbi:phospholipase [Paludibacter sp. 221]|uniref:patatin-like phospholipase family protein n=1 Tax=Paludibacter sp. 221 TaxID=2302939 RepID=UPI0013D41F51|nr:patatin-like phospholipase family protein [Paludibacter sp. 221]NDV46503.1 phospholipase [Paludibacter sp. 221]